MPQAPRIIVCGFGNPGREDDGAGIVVSKRLERELPAGVTVQYDYQLNIEDALEISDKDAVLFIDASANDFDGVRIKPVEPEPVSNYSTHTMSPGAILTVCRQLYGTEPPAWLLEIKGYAWDMREEMSKQAQANCETALHVAVNILNFIQKHGPAALTKTILKEMQKNVKDHSCHR